MDLFFKEDEAQRQREHKHLRDVKGGTAVKTKCRKHPGPTVCMRVCMCVCVCDAIFTMKRSHEYVFTSSYSGRVLPHLFYFIFSLCLCFLLFSF